MNLVNLALTKAEEKLLVPSSLFASYSDRRRELEHPERLLDAKESFYKGTTSKNPGARVLHPEQVSSELFPSEWHHR